MIVIYGIFRPEPPYFCVSGLEIPCGGRTIARSAMSKVTIWHNPRCSKSRQTLQLIRDRGIEPEIVDYLAMPPTEAELTHALAALGMQPRDLMRKKEAVYGELGLADESLSESALVEAMASHPILIERPLVFVDEREAVGRPPDNVLSLLD